MGGPNLEVFKFAMYISFPIGIMYYFGTNLDGRFKVDNFWPSQEQTYKIPFEREEIDKELARLKAKRLKIRDERLAQEARAKELAEAQGLRTQDQESS
ncbi:hypothetical protein EJ05DRAFT_478567 [Pseudovirgaria hyperparasitica]|uniref:Mitochondrial cytochrome c oxidase assembly factor n=1 Tax=Pseudovirgaria hyperparasitica TaxID=470096 RepID=A0A6A6W0T2_9PEZI|nr:uncharacterized protein EJ05DRAFT_478567 [Pseudovirgaria hyperparasitica]KAF2755594.1 hypothetical protein EJ05DRAFT_478567 [Pseudovirgaria hyperparasitica]